MSASASPTALSRQLDHEGELARVAVLLGHATFVPGGPILLCLLGLSRRYRWARRLAYVYLWCLAIGGTLVVVVGLGSGSMPIAIVGGFVATFHGWQVSVVKPAFASYALRDENAAQRPAGKR